MPQQAIREGEHGVDPVQGRTAIASMEEKIFLPVQQQVVKNAKIGSGSHALQPTQGVRVGNRENLREQTANVGGSGLQPAVLHPGRMIPQGALDAGGTVAELSENHGAGNGAAAQRVIGNPVLIPPQQHISVALAADPCQKPPPGRAEGQTNALFCTGTHQGRGGTGIGESDNGLESMKGVAGNHLLVPVCQHIFSLHGEINILGGDEQSIEQLLHRGSSMAALR